MLKQLIKLANNLDELGLYKEADDIDTASEIYTDPNQNFDANAFYGQLNILVERVTEGVEGVKDFAARPPSKWSNEDAAKSNATAGLDMLVANFNSIIETIRQNFDLNVERRERSPGELVWQKEMNLGV